MRKDIEDWIRLHLLPGVGPIRFLNLITHFGSPGEALKAGVRELSSVENIDKTTAEKIVSEREKVKVEGELKQVEKLGGDIICFLDDEYPELLKNIAHPPPILYIMGDIDLNQRMVAIVGTRTPTVYGRTMTREIARGVAESGLVVVSGLARGIDTEAHKGALEGGQTVAVLGSGIANIYPAENRVIVERIVENGAVISEFPVYAKPERGHFPRRNRVISGLSLGVVVTEAPVGSGALITANHALNQGREVMALPGSVMGGKSGGTHMLIKEGAYLVEDADDVLECLGLERQGEVDREEKIPTSLDENGLKIFNMLKVDEPMHIDDIIRETGLSSSIISSALLEMELSGFIIQTGGLMYMRARH